MPTEGKAAGCAQAGSQAGSVPSGGLPPAGTVLARARQECGAYAIRIGRDGTWYYKDSAIQRKPLVCLFASVLKRGDDGAYWLETPAERGRIEVEDAPFVAVELFWRDCDCGGGEPQQCLTFRTNLDEMVTADAGHPIRVQLCPRTREPRPYITVRPGLEARISRAVFYELVALAEQETVDGREVLGVWSEGTFFPIDEVPAVDMAAD
ncbi:DUF1285 domain-containing protein [Roseomonas terrae]|uniref:DUF1285 domain-containing protein n=2 Tax=Neoroseomonas terrae TaxID=424799 RepID=A0ABS5ENQ6_9PROT|nr:DUF1285 domain-containing protein [Neoroseomonas terrae]